MRKVLWTLPIAVAACALSGALSASPAAAQATPPSPIPAGAVELKVGDKAPDFTLPATDGKTYSLSGNLKGKWVALAWFPKAFTAG
jgi:thioredoxin-dependent peroxiredoxin